MSLDFQSLLEVYDSVPPLYIIDGNVRSPEVKAPETVDGASPVPVLLNVPLTSLLYALAEMISHERIPESGGAVIMRDDFVKEAEYRLRDFVNSGSWDASIIEKWNSKVVGSIQEISDAKPELPVKEIIIQVSERFRVSYAAMAQFITEYLKR